MTATIKSLLSDLKAGLETMYGSRLKGVYLYGSYARGEDMDGSDLDVLVVLDHIDRYGDEVDRTSELTADVSLAYGVTISKVFIRETDWIEGETPFLANVRREAIAA